MTVDDVPESGAWRQVPLPEVCTIIQGQSPPGSTYNDVGEGLPFYQGKAEFGELFPSPRKWCTAPKKLAEAGDVLISVRAPVGPTNLCSETAAVGRGLAALRPLAGIPSKYLLYALRATELALKAKASGSTFAAVTGSHLRAHTIPLAPEPVRGPLVEEIEKQFTRVDAAVAALQRVITNLRRYRASVLSSGCVGQLVSTEAERARIERRDYESGEELAAKIIGGLDSRLKAAARPGKERDQLSGLSRSEGRDSSELPEGWAWIRIGDLTQKMSNGLYLPQSKYGPGTPILRIDDYDQNGHSTATADLRCVQATQQEVVKYSLETRDLIINRVNAPSHLGKCFIVQDRNLPALFESNLIRLKLTSLINKRYVEYYLRSPQGRRGLTKNAKWAVNQASINQVDIGSTPVPLPPLSEQDRIVEEVELLLSIVDELEASVEGRLVSARRLRESTLHAAFAGKLSTSDRSEISQCLSQGL